MVNNARLRSMNRTVIVTNIREYDKHERIWIGDILKDTEHSQSLGKTVFFSRKYEPDKNEMDIILKEYHFTADPDVLDEEFWIIPSEKIIFLYEPSSLIEKAPLQFPQHGKRRLQ